MRKVCPHPQKFVAARGLGTQGLKKYEATLLLQRSTLGNKASAEVLADAPAISAGKGYVPGYFAEG
jgi:hypothetical protein